MDYTCFGNVACHVNYFSHFLNCFVEQSDGTLPCTFTPCTKFIKLTKYRPEYVHLFTTIHTANSHLQPV